MNRFRPTIRSPYPLRKAAPAANDSHAAVTSILQVQALVAELTRLRDLLLGAIRQAADTSAEIKQMKKGEPGDPGPSLAAVVAAVAPLIRHGTDGEPGADGISPDPEAIAAKVQGRIKLPPPPPVPTVDYTVAAEAVLALLHPSVTDPAAFVAHLATLPKGRRLKLEHVDGLKETIDALSRQTAGAMYLHGGGDTIKAGSNITATRNSDGTTTIASTGGGGFTTLTATETPDGVNKVFTFPAAAAQPSFVISDNVLMAAVTKKGTVNWTWNNAAKQASLSVAPADDIGGIV